MQKHQKISEQFFLITSSYFDKNINDERNELKINETPSLIDDLSWSIIDQKIQQIIDEIIIENFPDIREQNKKIISEAKDQFPYLAPYLDKDKSMIKNKEKIIQNAKKEFEREKNETSNKFKKLLQNKKIDTAEFDITMSNISDIASRELAEYIIYRQQIITALELMNKI